MTDPQRTIDGGGNDEDCWIPLETTSNHEPEATSSFARSTSSNKRATRSQTEATCNKTSNRMTPDDLLEIQQRLENKKLIRENLVDHPLHRFYMNFLKHLVRELFWSYWTIPSIRTVGLLLVVTGTVLWTSKTMYGFWWFLLRPRPTLLLVLALLFSCIYLFDMTSILGAVNSFLAGIQKVRTSMDSYQVLRWSLLLLLLIPTLLEMRIMVFLVNQTAACGHVLVVALVVSVFLSLHRHPSPRNRTMSGMVVLYTSPWIFWIITSALECNAANMMGGSMLLFWMIATGALLFLWSKRRRNARLDAGTWLSSHAVRQALRLSLHDVLSTLGEKVQNDEMLQLVMIRWVVDYWSSSRPPTAEPTASNSGGSAPSGTSTGSDNTQHQHELEWNELLPMLNMTTAQMANEIHRDSDTPSEEPQQNNNDSSPLQNLKDMLVSMNVDEGAKPAVRAYKNAVQNFPPSRQQAEIAAISSRCPSILALLWFLGKDSAGMLLSAFLVLAPFVLLEIMRVREWADACATAYQTTDTPRQEATTTSSTDDGDSPTLSLLPPDMDAMFIILSRDDESDNDESTLFCVWTNVCSSVASLETGLTAARCVQTTVVATEFAGNIMSLAHFGFEISQRGWMYGVTTMATELFMLHYQEQPQQPQQRNQARYANAAVHAVRNSKIMMHNAGVLMEEQPEATQAVVDNVTGFLTVLVGRGWLWGKDEDENPDDTPVSSSTRTGDAEGSGNESSGGVDHVTSVCDTTVSSQEGPPSQRDETTTEDKSPEKERTFINEIKPLAGAAASMQDPTKQMDSKNVAHGESSESNYTDTLLDESATVGSGTDIPCEGFTMEGEKLSSVMDQLANAYERGLVTTDEKNTFMEMLVQGTENVDVVKNSLDCLFQEAALQSQHQDASSEPLPTDTVEQITEPDKQEETTPISDSAPVVRDGSSVGDSDPVSGMGQDSLKTAAEIDTAMAGAAAESTEEKHGTESANAIDTLPHEDTLRSDDDGWIAMNDNQHNTEARPGAKAVTSHDSTQTVEADDEGIPHWVKVAAGVGLGVFGGMALVNSVQGGNEQEQRSTPFIQQEPPFDEENDTKKEDWESIPTTTTS